MNSKKIQKIKEVFNTIYLLKQEDINRLMSKFENLSDEAFEKILSVLNQSKEYQNKFIKRMINSNPSFLHDLDILLSKSYKNIADKVTLNEQKSANSVLDNLNDV